MRVRAAALLAMSMLVGAACEDTGTLAGPRPPAGALRFIELDVGYLHACGLTGSGRVYCWGGNTTGALGTGGYEQSERPVPVATVRDFAHLDVGSAHACALDEDGAAWCWGHNDEGQLGDSTRVPKPQPTAVAGGRRFTAISVGHAHACGLTATGAVWCWGDDTSGQLGNGLPDGNPRSTVPVLVEASQAFSAISAGYYQTCGLDDAGAAFCWGINYVGQNGDGTFESQHVPVAVSGGRVFETIAVGDGVVCGTSGDDAICWGSNRFHELARSPVGVSQEPVTLDVGDVLQVVPAIGAETIGGARPYACAIQSNRRAICWGGAIPAVRDGGPEPGVLDGSIPFATLAPGPQFVCGLRRDGYAFCAGANGNGQLGRGNEIDSGDMVPVAGP